MKLEPTTYGLPPLAAGAADKKAGIAEEAVYPILKTLPAGEPLDGGKHRYTLTFPAGQFPPVNAFWSVRMYDGKTQLLIRNPVNRYLINSPMLPDMKPNEDGSLTIHIQKDSPGTDQEANWLPAPDGPIYMFMRLLLAENRQPVRALGRKRHLGTARPRENGLTLSFQDPEKPNQQNLSLH